MKFLVICFLVLCSIQNPIPEERNGFIKIEAENYSKQTNNQERKWYKVGELDDGYIGDPDKGEIIGAGANDYLEILPDTRITHDDKLIPEINFSNTPGISVLSYDINFKSTGKYFVWVRAFSTGTEDNGIHVGINGEWPESGQRMQWCDGSNKWTWESKQRTNENHCGEAEKIYLIIDKPGIHTIQFSMREDGFAFDQFVLSKIYQKPE